MPWLDGMMRRCLWLANLVSWRVRRTGMDYMVPMVPSDLMLNFFLLVAGAQYFWRAGMDFTMFLVPKGDFLAYLASLNVWHFYPATSKSNFPLITKLRRLLVSIEFNWTPMIWSVKAWWSASGAIAERVSLWRGQVRWWTIYLVPSVDGMIDYIAFPVHRELLSDHQSKSFLVKNYLSSHSSIWISISLNRSNHPGSHSDILRSILVILAPKLVIQPLWYQKKFTHFGSFSIKMRCSAYASHFMSLMV